MLACAERHDDLMHRLVNDLLDVSRILDSKLHLDLKLCNLSAIVYDIVKDQSYMVVQAPHSGLLYPYDRANNKTTAKRRHDQRLLFTEKNPSLFVADVL